MVRRLLLVLCWPAWANAGIHYSPETPAELPANWRGYLLEHRALRFAATPPAPGVPLNPLREQYTEAASKLAAKRELTADEAADLGALYLRIGQPAKAIAILRPAQRQHADHFRIAANLGTAWQQNGDLNDAVRTLEEAVRLAPARWKPYEEAQLQLVRGRLKEPKNTVVLDAFWGIDFPQANGKLTDAERKKLPANDIALIQQLALWLPTDSRLLWLLGELCHLHGDTRTAASILEGCVTEMGLTQPTPRDRRQQLRTAADAIAKLPDADHAKYKGNIVFKSARPTIRTVDLSSLPAIRPDGVNTLPWLVMNETVIAPPFQPKFLKHLEQLNGKKVTLTGYMQPLTMDVAVGSFMLIEYPIGCWFCETPEPMGIVFVEVAGGKTTPVKRGRIKIQGTLKLNSSDPEDFLYTITGASVSDPD